ncbi:SPS1,serine threonine protein kinase [Alternaria alternata]|nr:SPS1,serine threonine protein kinase [Alternaria alternata]
MGAYQTLLAFPPPPPVDLKDNLVAEIDRRKQLNHLPVRGGFLTFDFIDRLFTVVNITQQLQKHEEAQRLSTKTITLYAQTIKLHQQKLYAILLLMDKSHCLLSDKAKAVTDRSLFEIPEPGLASLPCPLATLEASPLFHDFAHSFYEKQFVFPPSLPASRTEVYPPNFIFPFASRPKRIGGGSFGEVFRVEIPNGILSPHVSGYTCKNELVACKRVRRLGTESWRRVDLEYKVLHRRTHTNITPLRASFFAGLDDTDNLHSSKQCLYLLSPAADMSMEDWIEKQGDERPSSGFIYFDTMLALASGLAFIHREIDMMVAYHRDIKPSNILLFHSNKESFVWKFCDFGTSNLKPADNTGTTSMVTDKYWAPPEFFVADKNENAVTHGRAHDVFSLGCVFLSLVTLLHEGSTGISSFETDRKAQDKEHEGSPHCGAFYRTMDVVRGRIESLCSQCKENQDREVLNLISEMIKPIEKRIYSWEVDIDLFMLRQAGVDSASVDEYLLEVGHPSTGYNAKIKHNPFTRAKERAEKNHFYKVRCSGKYFYTMKALGWLEYSHQSTRDFRRTSEQHVYSNLSLYTNDGTLCGGQDLYREISDSFRESDIVALFGVAGIGKSRNAREYARQFVNSEDRTLKRHAFVVNVTSTDKLMQSYDDIAEIINGTIGEPNNVSKVTRHTIRSWLSLETTGKWFMVVDGFDLFSDTAELKKALPTPRDGMDQLLITTRSRAIINEYSRGGAHVPCIKVSGLGPADSMRLFKQNIEGWKRLKSEETDTLKIGNLLEKLWSPMMIKYVANQIELSRATVKQFKELVDDNGLSEVTTDFAPDESYLAHVLRPLTSNLSQTSSWPRELGTLFLLAFFDSGGVKWSILKENHGTNKKRKPLLTALGTLQDCAFVGKAERRIDPVYFIYGNIRQAILEWVEQNDGGAEGLLKRYNKALSITYKSYRSSLKAAVATPNASLKLYQVEQPFMPHFECFVRFTEKQKQRQKPLLHYLAVRGIICFSKVLLDHDRYREVMTVIEYSRQHYQYRFDEVDSEKQVQTFFTLGRHLTTIYLARSKDTSSNGYRNLASRLISELLSTATEIKDRYPGWNWLDLMSLEIKLDDVRVHRQSAHFEHAREKLSKISDRLDKMGNDDDEVVERYYENRFSTNYNNWIPQTHLSKQKLLITVKFQSGLLQMAEGNAKYQQDRKEALILWHNAQKSLLLAEHEAERHYPPDELWHDDIRIAIAVVNTRIGQKRLIQEAISMLELIQDRMEKRYGFVRRTMDVKRKLNEARLKSHWKHVNLATESSRELLHWYTEHFKEYANSGAMTMCTIDCASQLVRGLERMGRRDELEALKKKYKLDGDFSEVEDFRKLAMLLKLSCLCILVVALCLGYQYQYL